LNILPTKLITFLLIHSQHTISRTMSTASASLPASAMDNVEIPAFILEMRKLQHADKVNEAEIRRNDAQELLQIILEHAWGHDHLSLPPAPNTPAYSAIDKHKTSYLAFSFLPSDTLSSGNSILFLLKGTKQLGPDGFRRSRNGQILPDLLTTLELLNQLAIPHNMSFNLTYNPKTNSNTLWHVVDQQQHSLQRANPKKTPKPDISLQQYLDQQLAAKQFRDAKLL